MLIIKSLRLILSTSILSLKTTGLFGSAFIAFKLPPSQLLIYLPILSLSVWLTIKTVDFINGQLLEIQCSLRNLYKIKDEKLKLDSFANSLKEKEQYLRDAEIFLAKQAEKHNEAKKNLKKEIHEYHHELVNDFILKNSKNGTEQ